MPKTGVKQKKAQKVKTSTRSPFENASTIPKHIQDDSDVEMDGERSVEEDEAPEKDEAEKKLERMLFGDDEGFQGALRSQQDRGMMALTTQSDGESAGEEDGESDDGDDKGLEGVDDADVRIYLGLMCYLITNGIGL